MINILTMYLSLSSTLEFKNMNPNWKNLKYPEVYLRSFLTLGLSVNN